MRINFSTDKDFEAETRRIARILWSPKAYSGPITIDGAERDGLFENDDSIRCIEVTTSRTAAKAKHDCEKLDRLVRRLRAAHPDKGVTGWFITRDSPTGEQGAVLAQYRTTVNHRTFEQFFGMLIDSHEYLSYRNKKPFGSARTSDTNSFSIEDIPYVRVSFYRLDNSSAHSFGQLLRALQSTRGKRYLLLGEYGVGKSMALVEFYKELSRTHREGRDPAFPLYINLRDHSGETDPDMCIRKHAQSIGYSKPDNLIKAWRAGYVYLILDGFDEMTPRVATRSEKRARDLRESATSLVKRFVSETPSATPIILAGRNNYFDREEELFACTGVTQSGWDIYVIDDFSDEEAEKYLRLVNYTGHLPSWVPKKPLIVSYLVSQSIFEQEHHGMDVPGIGWNYLIDRICHRELDQVHIALEVQELRRIYGRIGTFARKKADPRGPISFLDCRQAFLDILEVEPEERNVTALLRLPGLSGSGPTEGQTGSVERGSRWFIEKDFADAVSSEDLYRFLNDPYGFDLRAFQGVQNPASDLMIDSAVERVTEINLKGSLLKCLDRAHEEKSNPVLYDIFKIFSRHSLDLSKNTIRICQMEINILEVECSNQDYSCFVFDNCYISHVRLFSDACRSPRFVDCQIESFLTSATRSELEDEGILFDSYLEEFNSIPIESDDEEFNSLTITRRIRCSLFDKIFIQSKSGRIEGALYRGFPESARKRIQDQVEFMIGKGWIFERRIGGQTIYYPVRGFTDLARRYLADPTIKLP
jgi:Predicted NTPase (NACHT family)